MTWRPVDPDPNRRAREEWERGGSSLLPSPAKLADRISTVLLLAFGALMTVFAGIVMVVTLVGGIASCDASAGCSPGGMIGGTAIGVGGAFVVGVVSVGAVIRAWVRRRRSWWLAAIGFVVAVGLLVWGGAVLTDAFSSAQGVGGAALTGE